MSQPPDKRSNYRLKLKPPQRCFFQSPGGGIARDAVLIDVGGGGCQIRTGVDYPLSGQTARVSFSLTSVPWDLSGTIVWKRRGLTGFFYGVKFKHATLGEEDRLVRALFALERSQRTS